MATRPDYRTQAELLRDLWDGSLQEQSRALKRLQAIGDAEALDAVVDYLQEAPPENIDEALKALRVLAMKYVPANRYGLADSLLPFLQSEDWAQRITAARLFNHHPNELAVDSLRDLLYDANDRVYEEKNNRFSTRRALAERALVESIHALANCGRLTVLPDIIDLLQEQHLRPYATRALGIIGSDLERPRLEELAEDRDYRVRDAAQWSLHLMDERAAQFMLPPDQQPTPPPDRLNSMYWSHRQLRVSDIALIQFMVVRLAVEHLILDSYLGAGRTPDDCKIILREHTQDTPPLLSEPVAPTRAWQYQFQGPRVDELDDIPAIPRSRLPRHRRKKGSTLVISAPESLDREGAGDVAVDCLFDSFPGGGWIYRLSYRATGWSFLRRREVWSS